MLSDLQMSAFQNKDLVGIKEDLILNNLYLLFKFNNWLSNKILKCDRIVRDSLADEKFQNK